MRIRSIKPEFWRSEDVTALAVEDRLLFIGLWSYVDDNGVGMDRLADVTADLFAGDVERDAPETFARVSRGLQNLSEAGRITRYVVDGKAYLHVTNWDRHQRIDKPNKPRFSLPTSQNATVRESVATLSRESRESPATGTGEQGNRGTGEQDSPSDADGADAAEFSDEVKLLCDLLAELVRANGHKVGKVGVTWWQACERLFRLDGYSSEQIEWLMRWATADEFWSANIRSMTKFREKFSTLKAQAQANPHGRGSRVSPQTMPTDRAQQTLDIGARLQAQYDQQQSTKEIAS